MAVHTAGSIGTPRRQVRRLRTLLRNVAERLGVEMRSSRNVPFGVDWPRDLKFFPEGRDLGVVLDVGANVGQTASLLLRNFPRCSVHCFEPVPATYARLESALRGRPRVVLTQAAVGAEPGEAVMTADPLSGQNTLDATKVAAAASTVPVAVTTVDAYCRDAGIDRVSLLKIDTEGHELAVLRGAERMLSTGRVDLVLAECDFLRRPEQPHGPFRGIRDVLEPLGFAVVSFYTGGVDLRGWVWGNVLFRHTTGSDAGRVACTSGATCAH